MSREVTLLRKRNTNYDLTELLQISWKQVLSVRKLRPILIEM